MANPHEIIKIRDIVGSWGNHKGALLWLFFAGFSGLLPIWFSLFSAWLLNDWLKNIHFDKYYMSGDIAIAAAGVVTSIVVILLKHRSRFPWFSAVLIGIIVLQLSCSLIWSTCNGTSTAGLPAANLDKSKIQNVSIGLFVLALIIGYYATLCDECIINVNPVELRARGQEDLEDAFRRLKP